MAVIIAIHRTGILCIESSFMAEHSDQFSSHIAHKHPEEKAECQWKKDPQNTHNQLVGHRLIIIMIAVIALSITLIIINILWIKLIVTNLIVSQRKILGIKLIVSQRKILGIKLIFRERKILSLRTLAMKLISIVRIFKITIIGSLIEEHRLCRIWIRTASRVNPITLNRGDRVDLNLRLRLILNLRIRSPDLRIKLILSSIENKDPRSENRTDPQPEREDPWPQGKAGHGL